MRFIARDTLTGETREIDEPDATVFELAENNDSCDYNRARWFGGWEKCGLPDTGNQCTCRQGPNHESLRFQIIEVLDWRNEHPEDIGYLND